MFAPKMWRSRHHWRSQHHLPKANIIQKTHFCLPTKVRFLLEVPPRFELGHKGVADLGLTAWLWYRITPYFWRFCKKKWSGKRDSNSRHLPWQGNALPLSHSRIFQFLVIKFGGNNRARTCDPLLVRQMLSQLSYAPTPIDRATSAFTLNACI